MKIKCKLSYNNQVYGKGKAYIAKIIGKDQDYKFKREFLEREIEVTDGSKTTWYSYAWQIDENGIYEWHENNTFKTIRKYFYYDRFTDKIEFIKQSEIYEFLEKHESNKMKVEC